MTKKPASSVTNHCVECFLLKSLLSSNINSWRCVNKGIKSLFNQLKVLSDSDRLEKTRAFDKLYDAYLTGLWNSRRSFSRYRVKCGIE